MYYLGEEKMMDNCIPEGLLLNIEIRHLFLFLATGNCDIASEQF